MILLPSSGSNERRSSLDTVLASLKLLTVILKGPCITREKSEPGPPSFRSLSFWMMFIPNCHCGLFE